MKRRPFLWGKYIWVLSDFGSSIRTEGAQNGINDKGLVTYDRQEKKNAFFYYKANWNSEPMIHITQKRVHKRDNPLIQVKIFSNLPEITLFINGTYIGEASPDFFKTIKFSDVLLQKGANLISVQGKGKYRNLKDECTWTIN